MNLRHILESRRLFGCLVDYMVCSSMLTAKMRAQIFVSIKALFSSDTFEFLVCYSYVILISMMEFLSCNILA